MKSIALLSTVYLYFHPISVAGETAWEYNDGNITVGKWAENYEECGGMQQSPIDVTFETDYRTICEEPLILNWQSSPMTFAIQNSGLSLKATPFAFNANGGGDLSSLEVLHHANDTDIRLQNGFYNTYTSPINEEYCFDSLHFHWGRNDSEGSEHTYNGKAYPLEVHLVHYSCDYYLLGPAVGDYVSGKVKEDPYDDQHVLAVIGVVFEIGKANDAIDQMLDDLILQGIEVYNDPTAEFGNHLLKMYYTELNLEWLLPDNREYIAYKGSLTTPPCLETVRWHNMKNPMTVSQDQMDRFRSILASDEYNDSQAPNYRPPQPLYNRTIYQCAEDVVAKYVEETKDDSSTSLSDLSWWGQDADPWAVVAVFFMILCGIGSIALLCLYNVAYGGIGEGKENDNYEPSPQPQQQPTDIKLKAAVATQIQIQMQQTPTTDIKYVDDEEDVVDNEDNQDIVDEDDEKTEIMMEEESTTRDSRNRAKSIDDLEEKLKRMETRLASNKKLI